ncbi:copper resistance D family protein [Serinicoccus sp. LYQ131]|uniref:copper resistance D family protein n=1 Tax=Serinicoccus sp. LYQ131 TaxID=3378797 RepID=UPI003852978E
MALSPLERTLPAEGREQAAAGTDGEQAAAGTDGPDRSGPAPVRRHPSAPGVLLAGTGVVLAAVLVSALVVGGGAPSPSPEGLPDAGSVTGWGLPVAHLLVRLLAVLTVGQLVFAALLASSSSVRASAPPVGASAGMLRALRGTTWTAAGWLAAELVSLVLTASTVYGVPVARLSTQAVLALATELPVGRATLWVAILLVLVATGSAWLARRSSGGVRAGARVLLVAALAAVTVPGVLAGHSAAAGNHVPAVVALTVHVLTASLWVGGLVALLLHGRDRFESVHAVRRFSALALGCLTLLLLSGVVAALLVAGVPSWSWVGEGWAQLLAVKTVLLLVLGLIGWQHRRSTLPALAAGRAWTFVRLGVVEVALMAATITVSVALGASAAPTPPTTGSSTSAEAVPQGSGPEDAPGQGAAPEGVEVAPTEDDDPGGAGSEQDAPVEDMSGHDHGDLSVAVLIDGERFHVASTVRPGQPVTVYNSSDDAATITSPDAEGGTAFDVEVPARTFITFPAPEAEGDYDFVSSPGGAVADGFADTLPVRAAP